MSLICLYMSTQHAVLVIRNHSRVEFSSSPSCLCGVKGLSFWPGILYLKINLCSEQSYMLCSTALRCWQNVMQWLVVAGEGNCTIIASFCTVQIIRGHYLPRWIIEWIAFKWYRGGYKKCTLFLMDGSAPADSNALTTARLFLFTARCKAVSPS